MEKYIYVLIPIAAFLYKAYLNYLKEQEKVKLRNLNKPILKENSSDFPDDFVGGELKPKSNDFPDNYIGGEIQSNKNDFPDDFIGGEVKENVTKGHFKSTDFLADKKKELIMRREEIKKSQKAAKDAVKDYYNTEIPAAEVANSRKIHSKHHHQFEFPKEEEEEKRVFDLREAVIQQAILNRPDY
ncbi:MAG: hypothetical protein IE931_05180 [Sphingobacteriales bacterium]|nr:hypothetical protein [Sphingobacteriales bacterium]